MEVMGFPCKHLKLYTVRIPTVDLYGGNHYSNIIIEELSFPNTSVFPLASD